MIQFKFLFPSFGCLVLCLGNTDALLLFVSSLKMALAPAAVNGLGTKCSPLCVESEDGTCLQELANLSPKP